jgi:hypothetical protein
VAPNYWAKGDKLMQKEHVNNPISEMGELEERMGQKGAGQMRRELWKGLGHNDGK